MRHEDKVEFLDRSDAAEALGQLARLEQRCTRRQIGTLAEATQRRLNFAARGQRRLFLEAQRRHRAGCRDQSLSAEQHHENEDDAENQLYRLDELDMLQPIDVDKTAERMDP